MSDYKLLTNKKNVNEIDNKLIVDENVRTNIIHAIAFENFEFLSRFANVLSYDYNIRKTCNNNVIVES